MIIAPSQPAQMAEAHRRAARLRQRRAASAPSLRSKNFEPILSLGSIEFVEFRGRAFGVPPVAWKVGEALNDARVAALEALDVLRDDASDRDATRDYYRAIRKIPSLLWANCYPTGKVLRTIKRIPILRGLLRNPFGDASDGELLEYADFFLARRMRSGGLSLHPMPATPGRRIS